MMSPELPEERHEQEQTDVTFFNADKSKQFSLPHDIAQFIQSFSIRQLFEVNCYINQLIGMAERQQGKQDSGSYTVIGTIK